MTEPSLSQIPKFFHSRNSNVCDLELRLEKKKKEKEKEKESQKSGETWNRTKRGRETRAVKDRWSKRVHWDSSCPRWSLKEHTPKEPVKTQKKKDAKEQLLNIRSLIHTHTHTYTYTHTRPYETYTHTDDIWNIHTYAYIFETLSTETNLTLDKKERGRERERKNKCGIVSRVHVPSDIFYVCLMNIVYQSGRCFVRIDEEEEQTGHGAWSLTRISGLDVRRHAKSQGCSARVYVKQSEP